MSDVKWASCKVILQVVERTSSTALLLHCRAADDIRRTIINPQMCEEGQGRLRERI